MDKMMLQNRRATLAISMLEKWGMVAAVDAGEDRQGRARFRLLSPEEIVKRACEVADLAYTEFERLGWLLDCPAPEVTKDK